ncbi:VOC family protein [Paenibacillus humicola]|uniref:VOC family protein n=1 Tax=Paenibacillus humicola TaxID=3110540 RepID=UPI00237BB6FD|nr:VOC family protein [Paenibacillus humicola]
MDRKPLETNTVTQIGILVHDIEKTAKAYSEFLGIEPRFVTTGTYEEAETEYMGSPSKARCRLAFFTVGPSLELELLQPDHEPSTWRHDLDKYGEGVHHIAFVVNGMKEKTMLLQRNNIPLLQKGEYPGGRYAYFDGTEQLKVVLELLEND